MPVKVIISKTVPGISKRVAPGSFGLVCLCGVLFACWWLSLYPFNPTIPSLRSCPTVSGVTKSQNR